MEGAGQAAASGGAKATGTEVKGSTAQGSEEVNPQSAASTDAPAKAEVPKQEAAAPPATNDTSNIKAEVVLMPKMSDTMNEGVIAAWHKKVGDTVKSGELMAEIETDKATMEYESYNTGTVLYLGVEAGKSVAVNGVLAIVGEKDADWATLLKAHQSKGAASSAESAKEEATPAKQETQAVASPTQESKTTAEHSSNGRIKASPLAKKMAQDKGYDLSKIKGSGDNGRITRSDIENYKPGAETPTQKVLLHQ